ncbi:MAG: 2-amino-4-hydroxy-6-hydroxymethyldihydropteridine diphosphokinase [Enhygromyxa sp.]
MTRFYVGLGSNLGDRLATLRSAVAALAALPGVTLARCSSIWETRPLGPGTGPFCNAAVELLCEGVSATELLAALLEIERAHGRQRRERWGDRTLDLDLLCGYADDRGELGDLVELVELVIDVAGLTLPHPGVGARDFVLQPLVDIDPELEIRGRTVGDWLAALPPEERTLLGRLDGELGEGLVLPDSGPSATVRRPGG